MYGGELIAGQGPRGRRPGDQAGIRVVDQRKANVDAGVGNFTIALTDLSGTQCRTTLSPPPHDLVTFVQQAPVEQVFQDVPDAFDIALVVGDVGLFEIDPKPQSLCQAFPFAHVTPDAGLTFLDERFDAVFLDFFFRVDAQFLADFDLHRQTVRIPTRLSLAAEATHGFVTGEQVLDGTCQAVSGVRLAIGRRWSLVKDKRRTLGTLLERPFVDLLLFPECEDFFFEFRKADVLRNVRKHGTIARMLSQAKADD